MRASGALDRPRELLPNEFFPTGCCVPGQRKVHIKTDGSLMPCERCGDNMIIGHLDSGYDMAMIHTLYEKLVSAVAARCSEVARTSDAPSSSSVPATNTRVSPSVSKNMDPR